MKENGKALKELVAEWHQKNVTMICPRLKVRFKVDCCIEFQKQSVNSVTCKGCDNYMEDLPRVPFSFVPISDYKKKSDMEKHYVKLNINFS